MPVVGGLARTPSGVFGAFLDDSRVELVVWKPVATVRKPSARRAPLASTDASSRPSYRHLFPPKQRRQMLDDPFRRCPATTSACRPSWPIARRGRVRFEQPPTRGRGRPGAHRAQRGPRCPLESTHAFVQAFKVSAPPRAGRRHRESTNPRGRQGHPRGRSLWRPGLEDFILPQAKKVTR